MRTITPEARERMHQGGKTRAKQFTRESQQHARSFLPREICAKGGKTAYKMLVDKYGVEYAMDKAAEWRLEHPSNLERIIIDWLSGIDYEREVKFNIDGKIYYVDFLIGSYIIEANGNFVHSMKRENDNQKYRNLTLRGYTVIILPESDILSGEAKLLVERIIKR